MTGLDTNLLVNWILGGSEPEFPGAPPYRVSNVVLAELVWVLGSLKRPRAEIATVLRLLLATRELRFHDRRLVEAALADYAGGPAGFADYLIVHDNAAAGCSTTWTRDRKAARHPAFRLAE